LNPEPIRVSQQGRPQSEQTSVSCVFSLWTPTLWFNGYAVSHRVNDNTQIETLENQQKSTKFEKFNLSCSI
jgi:hypothetical protein